MQLTNKRVDLGLPGILPLAAPFMLFVEPTNVCNFRCTFCPESFSDYGARAGYYRHMTPETWTRVLTSLRGWCRLKTIRFYDTGEPFLNRELDRMIMEAHEITDYTEVTSNGSVLTEDWARRIIAAGLDYIRVSIYATTSLPDKNSATGTTYDLARILNNVRGLRRLRGTALPFIYAELVTTEVGQEALFAEQWSGIADRIGVKRMHSWGAELTQLALPSKKRVCPFPFYELCVKANGDVTVCCVDWNNKLKVGNVNLTPLREIWNGPELRAIRDTHLSGNRHQLPSCRDCTALDLTPDNIDSLIRL